MALHQVEPDVFKTPQMRNLPQISVTTTPKRSERLGSKFAFIENDATAVEIAFSFKRTKEPQTDYIDQPASKMYKYIAPKGFKFVFVFVKCATTATLDIIASEIDFENVR